MFKLILETGFTRKQKWEHEGLYTANDVSKKVIELMPTIFSIEDTVIGKKVFKEFKGINCDGFSSTVFFSYDNGKDKR